MKLVLRLYFRKIKIEGRENVPLNTPLIVTPNHQNAFLDALLVGAFIPISLHYLTRSDVFTWWSKPFLRLMNMTPIYRIRDGYAKLSLNDSVFEGCQELFSKEGSVLIFAEGNHGKHYYLRPLTKGAARLALQSQEAMDKDLMVLPVGLNYFDHQAPKSTVLISFGKPIPVNEYIEEYRKNQAKGLIKMRDAISAGMKESLVIPEETPNYDKRSKTIFQESHEDKSFQELRSVDPSLEIPRAQKKRKRHVLAWLLNPLPLYIIHRIIRDIDDVVFHSSLKFGIGLFVFPLWWLLIFWIMFFSVGINIALLTVIVMVFGLFYSYQR
ncbi:MAG: lysophospholipid acyltransferase family protein [Ekhidna sp.]